MSNPFFNRYTGCQSGHEYSTKFPCFASMKPQALDHNTSLNVSICTLPQEISVPPQTHHYDHHLSLNHEGRWGTTDGFTTSFLHFSKFSTALWDLANSKPVHSLMLSSHLFLCLPCLLPPFTVVCKMVLVRPD